MSYKNVLRALYDLGISMEDPPAGGGEGDPNPLNFSGKWIEKIDPVTKKTLKIPEELDAYIGHSISVTRSSVEQQYKPLLESLEQENAEFKDIKEQYERLKDANLTEQQRIEKETKKKIDEAKQSVEKAEKETSTWKNRFFDSIKRTEILSAFGETKLFNPAQVALVFESEGNAVVEEIMDDYGKPTGNFQTKVTLELENDKGELETVSGTPASLFKRWIESPRNFHHVQVDVNPGNGTNPGGQRNTRGEIDYSGMSPTEKINAYREHQKGKGAK